MPTFSRWMNSNDFFFGAELRTSSGVSQSEGRNCSVVSFYSNKTKFSHFTCLLAFKTNAQVSRSERDSRRAVALIALLSTGDSTINSMEVPCNSFNVGCGENASFPTLLSNEAGKNKTHLISKTVTENETTKTLSPQVAGHTWFVVDYDMYSFWQHKLGAYQPMCK